jgi:hypothetical protein
MGNFYVNFSVRTADQQRIADALRRAGRVALVTAPDNDYIVIYDEEADSQATAPILKVGGLLSEVAQAPVLAMLNHDDDILCYWLFEQGQVTDSYNSRPDYFGEGEDEGGAAQGGDVQRLCAAIQPSAIASEVEKILRAKHVFAVEQHEKLARLLGLPSLSVGYGFEYAAEELEEEMGAGEMIRIG